MDAKINVQELEQWWVEFGETFAISPTENKVYGISTNIITGKPMITWTMSIDVWEEAKKEYINQGLRVEKIN